jgi:hypothetical protein
MLQFVNTKKNLCITFYCVTVDSPPARAIALQCLLADCFTLDSINLAGYIAISLHLFALYIVVAFVSTRYIFLSDSV